MKTIILAAILCCGGAMAQSNTGVRVGRPDNG
jgi:hypothetical protein